MASNSFQRSPSKVWWAHDLHDSSSPNWHNRTENGSPSSHKSQDSGFSDSEISPNLAIANKNSQNGTPHRACSTNEILKDNSYNENVTPKKNLTENCKDKYSAKKSITTYLTDENNQRHNEKRVSCCRSLPGTPKNQHRTFTLSKSTSQVSTPNQSPKFSQCRRLSLYNEVTSKLEENKQPKVNRNLMKYFSKDFNDNITKDSIDLGNREILHSVTLPIAEQPTLRSKINLTVPLYYQINLDKIETDFTNNSDSEASYFDTSNEVLSSDSFSYQQEPEISDCEKEIESFFTEQIHTSTPKGNLKKCFSPLRKKIARQKKNYLFETEKIPETNPKLLPQFPPVKCWLNEVEQLYEPECMTTLQCKSIANDLARQVNDLAENLTQPIREIMKHSRIIQKEFNKIKIQLQRNRLQHIGPLTQSLVGNITEYVLKNMVNAQANSLVDAKQTKNEIHNLLEISSTLRQATTSTLDVEKIYTLLLNLQDLFYSAERKLLSLQIQLLINAVEEPGSHLTLRASLFGLTCLALQCERLNDLIVQSGGPRALLIVCVENKASTIRTMALRTLATICCTTNAIRQLEAADGIDVLSEILSDQTRPEPELSEATSVLTQITAPWIEDNRNVKGLTENISTLVTAVTSFLSKTQCCQNLLLCAAALANITYMNTNAVGSLIENKTIKKLLEAVRSRGPRASVFLKEQTATLIANLSDIPEAREHLAEYNTGVALLCFLQIYPVNSFDEAQNNAAQRLQQKSAIALSRLCGDLKVSRQIVELGGTSRLVQLCKEGKERNNSDAVLVACLIKQR